MTRSLRDTPGPVLLYRFRDFRGAAEYRTYRPELDVPGAVLYHFRLITQSPPEWEFVSVGRAVAPAPRRDRRRRTRPAFFVCTGEGAEVAWAPAPWPYPAGARLHVQTLTVDELGDVVESYDPCAGVTSGPVTAGV